MLPEFNVRESAIYISRWEEFMRRILPVTYRNFLIPSAGLFFLLALCQVSSAGAEVYVGGYLGGAFPDSLSITGSGAFSGVTVSDQKLQNSLLYGGKLGMFLPGSLKWLGFETEVFNTNPNLKQQNLTVTGPGGSVTSPISESHLRVTTWAVNAVVRYPGEKFQPYAGVGLGVFFHHFEGASEGRSPGLNAMVGLRYMVTEHVGLFGEYKYDRAVLKLEGPVPGVGTGTLDNTYSVSSVVGGLSFHF